MPKKIAQQINTLIIGAGASGLMCAAQVGYQGQSVLVLDHAPRAAAKIRISGGGRCNFTNEDVQPHHFICGNPHFVKSALSRYQPHDFIELVERHALAYQTRELGKLFCEHKASDLIHILRTECDWAGVNVETKTTIKSIIAQADDSFIIECISDTKGAQVQQIHCQSLVIATGALSFPKLKSSGLGYDIATQFKHKIVQKRPGLVPLLMADKWLLLCQMLSGSSIDVQISVQNQSFSEPMLFTHTGLSGPAILQASNYWQKGEPLVVNLLPTIDVFEALQTCRQNGTTINQLLNQHWPKKLTQYWLATYLNQQQIEDISNQSNDSLKAIAKQLTHWTLYPADTAGYDKAEVTLGGIDTQDISSKTMESTLQPNLYFIGEVLDVTGQLGGYNFQWAWASGYACAMACTKST